MRVKITLACTECKQRNYNTFKNKKNDPDRLEFAASRPSIGKRSKEVFPWLKNWKRKRLLASPPGRS